MSLCWVSWEAIIMAPDMPWLWFVTGASCIFEIGSFKTDGHKIYQFFIQRLLLSHIIFINAMNWGCHDNQPNDIKQTTLSRITLSTMTLSRRHLREKLSAKQHLAERQSTEWYIEGHHFSEPYLTLLELTLIKTPLNITTLSRMKLNRTNLNRVTLSRAIHC